MLHFLIYIPFHLLPALPERLCFMPNAAGHLALPEHRNQPHHCCVFHSWFPPPVLPFLTGTWCNGLPLLIPHAHMYMKKQLVPPPSIHLLSGRKTPITKPH